MTDTTHAKRAEDRAMLRLAGLLGLGYCAMMASVWWLICWVFAAIFG